MKVGTLNILSTVLYTLAAYIYLSKRINTKFLLRIFVYPEKRMKMDVRKFLMLMQYIRHIIIYQPTNDSKTIYINVYIYAQSIINELTIFVVTKCIVYNSRYKSGFVIIYVHTCLI